jgi:hypothetical protein
MPARYGEHDCCDVIEAARWARHAGVDPSEWEGKANGYSCPVGVEYGEGHVLLRRFQLKKLAKGRDDLSIRDAFDLVIEYNGDKVTCKNLYVVAAVSCHPSPDDDDNALYHVKLADVRYVLRHYALCVGYNLRETPTGNYQSATTNGGTAWTWAEVNDDIWSNLSAVGGDTPTIVGTPDGTPDELNYYGEYALTAYGSFLDRLAQALCYDPTAGTFSVVKPGAADSAADRAKDKYKKNRLDDAGPIEPVPGRIPSSVRVLFRKEPERAYGNDPYVGVTVADTDPAAGALADSEVILRDDLIADYQGGLLTNLADLQTRATERASAYFRAVKDGASRLNRVYRGALKDFLPGSQHKLVAWRDAGRGTGPQAGVTTEVFRYPPDVTSRWPSTPPLGWRNNEIVGVSAPLSGGKAADGTDIPERVRGRERLPVVRPGNGAEGLFDCWAVDIVTWRQPVAGKYPTSTFGGFKEGRPVYVVGCCPDGDDVGRARGGSRSTKRPGLRTCGNVLIQTSCGYTICTPRDQRAPTVAWRIRPDHGGRLGYDGLGSRCTPRCRHRRLPRGRRVLVLTSRSGACWDSCVSGTTVSRPRRPSTGF